VRVYHGSYCIVDKPDISFSRDSLDFGKGFYVTNIEKQAISWTDRFKKRGKKGSVVMEANKTLLQSLYKEIILEFSKETGKDLDESMDYFYKSETYELISQGVSDLHCRGYKYLAQELMLEYGIIKHKSYPNDLVH